MTIPIKFSGRSRWETIAIIAVLLMTLGAVAKACHDVNYYKQQYERNTI